MKGKYLAGLVSALVLGVLSAAPAIAHVPQFYNHAPGAGQETLRSVVPTTSKPSKLQPDALEFVNSGNATFTVKPLPIKKGETVGESKFVTCNEVEFGTTVVSNTAEGQEKTLENKLALPFGVAEGNSCVEPAGAPIPTYFDTTLLGVVPANITFKGGPPNAPIFATIHKLKLSMNFGGTFCTIPIEGMTGEVINYNGLSPLEEEKLPNLELAFVNAPSGGFATCEGSTRKYSVSLTASFFAETLSTLSDTVWIE